MRRVLYLGLVIVAFVAGMRFQFDRERWSTTLEPIDLEPVYHDQAASTVTQGLPALGVRDEAGRFTEPTEGDYSVIRLDHNGYVLAKCMPSVKVDDRQSFGENKHVLIVDSSGNFGRH